MLLVEAKRDETGATVRRLHETVTASLTRFPGLSVSLGAAFFDDHLPSLVEMMQSADSLMYRAKKAGGGALVGNFVV